MKKKWTTYVVLLSIILNFFISGIYSDLVFASVYGDVDQDIKTTLLEAMKDHKEKVSLHGYDVEVKDIVDVFNGVYFENPQYFGTSLPLYSYYQKGSKKIVSSVTLEYDASLEISNKMMQEMERERSKILSGITSDMTDVQKALYVHDYLILNCEYDYDVFTGKDGTKHDYNAYGVLVQKKGVCMGYSLAYNYIMNELGIETTMVTSEKMNHAWNLIKIDGSYYHVDISWDDKLTDTLGYVAHENFLLSDEGIKATAHNSWDSIAKADNKKYDNYFWKDIYSAFVYLNNECYYFDRKTSYIKKYNPKTNKSANVFNVESVKENIDVVYSKKDSSNKLCNMKWYDYSNSNLIYNRKYVYLAVVDNCMFFNTNSQIYQVDIKNKKAVKVFTVPKNEIGQNKGWLYGIAFNNNKLYYQVKKSMGSQFVGINKEVKGSYVTYKETSTQKEENDENSLSKASVILSKTVFTYDGKACTPSVKVSMNNKQLTVNKDYKVTYTSNNTIGRAYVNVTGIGDYTGTKSVGFNIYMPTASHLTSYANTSNSISIKWSSIKGITGYEIYRCDSQNKNYKLVYRTKNNSYTDKNLNVNGLYTYKVRAFLTKDGKTYYGEFSSPCRTFSQKYSLRGIKISIKGRTATFEWDRLDLLNGYQVQRSNVKTKGYITIIKKASANMSGVINKNLMANRSYYYRVRGFKTENGKTMYTGWSSVKGIRCK